MAAFAQLMAGCAGHITIGPFRFGRPSTPPPPPPPPLTALVEPLFDPAYLPYVFCAVFAFLFALRLTWPKRRRLPGFPEVAGRLPIVGHGHLLGKPERLTEQFEAWLDEYGGDEGVCECKIGGARGTSSWAGTRL
jgi:hypothetical protein